MTTEKNRCLYLYNINTSHYSSPICILSVAVSQISLKIAQLFVHKIRYWSAMSVNKEADTHH